MIFRIVFKFILKASPVPANCRKGTQGAVLLVRVHMCVSKTSWQHGFQAQRSDSGIRSIHSPPGEWRELTPEDPQNSFSFAKTFPLPLLLKYRHLKSHVHAVVRHLLNIIFA